MKCLAAIDVGTTGAKAAVFYPDGRVLAEAYREYGCSYPRPNWVEQDVHQVVGAALDTMREAVEKSAIDPCDIVAVAASTQRTCSIFLDDQERVLKMISWQDGRTVEELADIRRLVPEEEYYRITGLPISTTWIVTKMLWMRKRDPELWHRTRRVVQLQDYLLRQLGAPGYFVDMPDAVMYGLWDTDHFCWSDFLLERLGVDCALLPQPVRCATRVGTLSPQAALRTGLREGTPLCVGAGDQNAAAVGAGIVREGIASVSIGTGGMAIQLLRHPYRDPAGKICVGAHALYGNWQVEGYQTGAAGVFRWFRDTMAQWEKHQAGLAGEGVYERLDALAAQTPPGADGLVLLPYFASSAAPRWNANARGTLMGLTFAHGMGHLARAFMEGIALEQKDILRSMERAGGRVARIRLTGGASKSPLWCQIQADMYGVPVETLQMSDTALAGAAVFAGVGAGLFGSVEQGVARMVHPSATFSPNAQTVTRYERLYGAYDRAVLALEQSGVFDEIAALQREGDTI